MFRAWDENEKPTLPEENLCAAILARAWADLDYLNDDVRESALAFIEGRPWRGNDVDEFWSFASICEVLGVEAESMKTLMLRYSYHQRVANKANAETKFFEKRKKSVRHFLYSG